MSERARGMAAGRPSPGASGGAADRAHERDRFVVENLAQVIFQTDVSGRWTFLSPAWTALTGFEVNESLGRCFLDFVHPDDRSLLADLLPPPVDREGDCGGRLVRYITRIGTERWVEVRAQPIADGARIAGSAGTLTDVTGRWRAEQALPATRARLRQLLISSPAVIYSRDVRGGFPFTFVSDNAAGQLGVPAQALLEEAARLTEHLHPDDAAAESAALERLVAEEHQSCEYRVRRADGTYRWIHDERTLVCDPAGRPTEVIGSWLDVTARRLAEGASAHLEQELRHAQKLEAVGRLAGTVAHDCNNLLTVIIGRCELLSRRVGRAGPAARDVDIVMATARRASALTSQLLALSREPPPPAQEDRAAAPGGSETVLVTEDSAVVRDLTVDLLRGGGYTVLAAATPEEALAVCRSHSGPIHLLLTDVILPGMRGGELAERACRLRPDMRVLFASGYPEDDDMVRAGIQQPDVVFLAKPFTAEALSRKVRQALDRPA